MEEAGRELDMLAVGRWRDRFRLVLHANLGCHKPGDACSQGEAMVRRRAQGAR